MDTLLRYIGLVWLFPHTLFGLIRAKRNGCELLKVEKGVRHYLSKGKIHDYYVRTGTGAQMIGAVVIYLDMTNFNDPIVRIHELTHVRQALLLGPLFYPLYMLESYCIVLDRLISGASKAEAYSYGYWHNYFERQAYSSAKARRTLGLWEGIYRSPQPPPLPAPRNDITAEELSAAVQERLEKALISSYK